MAVSTFLKRFRFEELARVVSHSFKRFPVSASCVVLSFVLLILSIHEIKLLSDEHMGKLILFLAQAAVFAVSVQLFSESRSLNSAKKWLITGGGALVLAASIWLPEYVSSRQLYISGALVLLVLFAPYIRRPATEDSVWYFNYLNALTVALAWVSALIFSLGLCAVVGSVEYLFEIHDVSSKVYADIWTTGWSLLFPLFLLAQLPSRFDFEKQECVLLPGIYFIANYLAVPLSLTYMFILYAYFGKIVLQWQLPRGNLAYMVSGFGALGIVTYLAVYPMRETGTRLLQQFYKYFFSILIIPIVLLALGIYTRISQYGITEERYNLALCWIWFASLSVLYAVWRRYVHIKYIPMILCMLALLASSGPWSAVSLSVSSQAGRLGPLLTKVGVIGKDGSIQKAPAQVSFEDRKSISSIVDYLASHHALQKISAWTEPFHIKIDKNNKIYSTWFDGPYDSGETHKILEAWGIRYVSQWERDENFTSGPYFGVGVPAFQRNELIKAAPYEYVITVSPAVNPSLAPQYRTWTQRMTYSEAGKEVQAVTFTMTENGDFALELADGRKAVFLLQPLAENLYRQKIFSVPDSDTDMMILHKTENGIDVLLRISSLHGQASGDHVTLGGGTITVLFTPSSAAK